MLYLVYAYLVTGLLVAFWFSFFQAGRIYIDAARSGIGFKLIILPAALLLWPLVICKRMKTEK
jgi:TM2 domain-containing membrane protein YozV